MLLGATNNVLLPGDCTIRGGEILFLWMEKASLEQLLLPSQEPETECYPVRPNHYTLPVVSTYTATEPCV